MYKLGAALGLLLISSNLVFGKNDKEDDDCPEGFTGATCAVDINECQSDVCYNNATCSNTPGNFTCLCVPGWTGVQCSDAIMSSLSIPDFVSMINLVASISQEERGNCSASATSGLLCQCSSAWTGVFCQADRDECNESICGVHQCDNQVGGYECTCNSGWTGTNCGSDIDECQKGLHDCGSSQCVNGLGSFACECSAGFTGPTCTEDINECETISDVCANGICVNKNGYYVCDCYSNYCSLTSLRQDCGCVKPRRRGRPRVCPSSCYE